MKNEKPAIDLVPLAHLVKIDYESANAGREVFDHTGLRVEILKFDGGETSFKKGVDASLVVAHFTSVGCDIYRYTKQGHDTFNNKAPSTCQLFHNSKDGWVKK